VRQIATIICLVAMIVCPTPHELPGLIYSPGTPLKRLRKDVMFPTDNIRLKNRSVIRNAERFVKRKGPK
jgi:hypothetical protein